jgi:hypothetical protein
LSSNLQRRRFYLQNLIKFSPKNKPKRHNNKIIESFSIYLKQTREAKKERMKRETNLFLWMFVSVFLRLRHANGRTYAEEQKWKRCHGSSMKIKTDTQNGKRALPAKLFLSLFSRNSDVKAEKCKSHGFENLFSFLNHLCSCPYKDLLIQEEQNGIYILYRSSKQNENKFKDRCER